jgi:hypothetical protein
VTIAERANQSPFCFVASLTKPSRFPILRIALLLPVYDCVAQHGAAANAVALTRPNVLHERLVSKHHLERLR